MAPTREMSARVMSDRCLGRLSQKPPATSTLPGAIRCAADPATHPRRHATMRIVFHLLPPLFIVVPKIL